jgi:hypothetical protein
LIVQERWRMDILGVHIPSLVGAGAAFTSVYAAFAKFDADQSEDNRKFVRAWLLGLQVDDRRWGTFFTEIFTRIFGARHFSLKCLLRSAALSTSLLAILWGYWIARFGSDALLTQLQSPYWPLGLVIFVGPPALVADYLSLWKTRALLTRSHLFANALATAAIVIGDAFATIVIFIVIFNAFLLSLAALAGQNDVLEHWQTNLTGTITFALSWPRIDKSSGGFARLTLLAPLLTSAWLWLYLTVAYLMRAASHLPHWLRPLSKVLDVDGHPVRSIGYVAATVSAVVVGAIALFS